MIAVIVSLVLILAGCLSNPQTKKQPSWNSSTIIYNSEETGNWDIFAMNKDGSGKLNLTKNKAWDFYPSWSSKRDKIAFTSDRSGNNDIFIMERDGSNVRNLTKNKANDVSSAFSPDGKYITFASDRHGLMSIYRIKSDGSELKRLTSKHIFAGPAVFSPDGKSLILKRQFFNPGRFEFFLSNIDGKNVRKMDPLHRGHEDPVFSKDGSEIIFSAFDEKSKTWQIFKVDATGKKLQCLTDDFKGSFSKPFYSPNEKQIIYTRMERFTGDWSLWLMNADGNNQRRITPRGKKVNGGIFSADGQNILAMAISSGRRTDFNWYIATLSVDNFKERRLTLHNQANLWPRWFEAKNIP